MTVAARLSDDEVAEKLAAVAPPLDAQQRALLGALWRRGQEPCRPDVRQAKPAKESSR